MNIVTAYPDFETASAEVLAFLSNRIDFQLWMVTRTEAEDWIVLDARDQGYGVKSGDVFRWSDSFCSQMVKGLGPRVAPTSDQIPAYHAAPIGQQVDIGAYIGIPLNRSCGKLFGTLCAINPEPMPNDIKTEQPLVELMGRLLMTGLENDLKAQQADRRAERATADAMKDELTGLYNRRGWEDLLATEDSRCHRYGHPACIFSIDLDELKLANDQYGHASGDALLVKAARILQNTTRTSDIVARIGGDEFALLALECDQVHANVLMARLEAALRLENVAASIGMSMRRPPETLAETLKRADVRMYESKRAKKAMSSVPCSPIDSSSTTPCES